VVDDRHYVPGSFYRIDDRTGYKIRAEHTRKEWTGRIVREQSWEPRQPQDLVRGVRDDQNVPEPRPRQQNVFIDPNFKVHGILSSSNQQALGWPNFNDDSSFTLINSGANAVLALRGAGSGVYNSSVSSNQSAVVPQFLSYTLSFIALPISRPVFGLLDIADLEPNAYNASIGCRVEVSLNSGLDWRPAYQGEYVTQNLALRIVAVGSDPAIAAYVTAFNFQVGSAQ
jgi:hypothetical protein